MNKIKIFLIYMYFFMIDNQSMKYNANNIIIQNSDEKKQKKDDSGQKKLLKDHFDDFDKKKNQQENLYCEIIKQEMYIDIVYLMYSKKDFIYFFLEMNVIIWILFFFVITLPENFLSKLIKCIIYFVYSHSREINSESILQKFFLIYYVLIQSIIIPIINYYIISKLYTKKIFFYNNFFKILYIFIFAYFFYTRIDLEYIQKIINIIQAQRNIDISGLDLLICFLFSFMSIQLEYEFLILILSYLIQRILGIPFLILIINHALLIYTYIYFCYQTNPMKYKEKRDYINSLKNINHTPIQVLDNDLDNNLIDKYLIVNNNL
jgi:hypothetical protein